MATLTETFTNIANSIRLKTETTDKITPENMPSMIEGITTGGNVAELSITSNGTYRAPEGIDGYTPVIVNVPQDGSPPPEAFVITDNCGYRFANNGWNWFIKQYGNQITTNNITSCSNMFSYCDELEEIPFDINCNPNYHLVFGYMFAYSRLVVCPKITAMPASMDYMFVGCKYLKEIPESINTTLDWSLYDNSTSGYEANMRYLFNDCYSLRKIPEGFLNHPNKYATYSYSIFNNGFGSCRVLDELIELPTYENTTWSSNAFSYSFDECNRLNRLTFKINEDGTPFTVKWKNQTIDLTKYVGYCYEGNTYNITGFSGLTNDTKIIDDATYQQLKDNPDNWTANIKYSRYNKTSAIETINSLPDASAYGTNTIKFKGDNGSLTDGGAINTMTEEEIAVAVAKGWTVSFS